MKPRPIIVLLIFLFLGKKSFSQVFPIDSLDHIIYNYNNDFQYEKSITLLSDLIADKKYTSYDRYTFYLLKSYTYKRLFSYPQALHNLDLALREGLKSDKKEIVTQSIRAEKSFIYFDTQDYEKAAEVMKELSASKYVHLEPNIVSFILLQEAYLLMNGKKYDEAEKKTDDGIAIAREHSPQDLPLFYGKKVQLYNTINKPILRDQAFAEGYRIAEEYGIIKYQMHLYEIVKSEFQKNKDYKRAFEAQKKYDSLALLYDSVANTGKIDILDKQIEEQRKQKEMQNQRLLQYFIIFVAVVLLILFIFSTKLYLVNKRKRNLTEKENQKIHSEVEKLTQKLDKKGDPEINLAKFELTNRQLEIITLVKQGKSNKEIAAELFISENTVKYHLKVIYEILNIEHRTQLAQRS